MEIYIEISGLCPSRRARRIFIHVNLFVHDPHSVKYNINPPEAFTATFIFLFNSTMYMAILPHSWHLSRDFTANLYLFVMIY